MLAADPQGLSWIRFVIAAVTVLGLMGALAFALKYIVARGWLTPMQAARRRLKIIESLPLDARRRAVIIACDGAEHLLLLGVNQDMVVATNLPAPPTGTASETPATSA